MPAKPINFLRLFNKEGQPVRDFKINENVNPVESADFFFDRNDGVDVIQFITAAFDDEGKVEETVLLTAHREDMPELREAGFCFFVRGNEPDPAEDETAILHPSEMVKAPVQDIRNIQARFLLRVVRDPRFHKLTIEEANDLSEMLADSVTEAELQ